MRGQAMPTPSRPDRKSDPSGRRRFAAVVTTAVLALLLAVWIVRPPPRSAPPSFRTRPDGCYDRELTSLEARERGAIVVLLRTRDLAELLPTLRNFEQRFNAQFRYPYVFLTDPEEPGLDQGVGGLPLWFRRAVAEVLPDGAVTEWGVVPPEHWTIPDWLDKEEIRRGFREQEERGVLYAGREGYHHMCRWYSGLFARHPLLAQYEWYWRLEPGGKPVPPSIPRRSASHDARLSAVRFHCSITYDPFRYLSETNKTYGFVISVVDQLNTMPTLIPTTLEYLAAKGIHPPSRPLWKFLMRRNGAGDYAACHFWTNFEASCFAPFRPTGFSRGRKPCLTWTRTRADRRLEVLPLARLSGLFQPPRPEGRVLHRAGRSLPTYCAQSYRFNSELNSLIVPRRLRRTQWGDAPVRALALGAFAGLDKIH